MRRELLLCVSLNPAIDKRLTIPKLEHGGVNRAAGAVAAPGGKAAHVAMVLHILGAKPVWVGFHGGAEGAALLKGLNDLGIRTQGVPISGRTRTNLEILDSDGTVTELLEPGPTVTPAEMMKLTHTCEGLLRESARSTALVLSGSLPPGAPADCYAQFVRLGYKHGAKVYLDTHGKSLRRALKARPDFVKANQSEASEVTGTQIKNFRQTGVALQTIVRAGARSAAISLGGRGLAWQPNATGPLLYASAPSVKVVSAVGSGDAALAGFVFGCSRGLDSVETLQLAVACGAANCLAELPGQPREKDIDRLRDAVVVEPLEAAMDKDLQSC
jgi:1-phosphofructokinase family hexose kinase